MRHRVPFTISISSPVAVFGRVLFAGVSGDLPVTAGLFLPRVPGRVVWCRKNRDFKLAKEAGKQRVEGEAGEGVCRIIGALAE